MKTKLLAMRVKDVSEAGTFTGYGSTFGNVDSYGDVVMPGAFVKSLSHHANEGSMPLMLWQHDPDNPIGVWESLEEDAKGLKCSGRLLLEVTKAREAYAYLKAGAIRGLSIGYHVVKADPDGNVLRLKEIDLLEISVVSFAANRRATVTGVKSERMDEFARRLRDGEPMPVKEFEDILREAGVPKAMAVQIASVGYAKAIRSESEGAGDHSAVTPAAIENLKAALGAFLPRP